MKTPEELNALKNEVENLNKKLAELTDEELKQVNGGAMPASEPPKYPSPGVDFKTDPQVWIL